MENIDRIIKRGRNTSVVCIDKPGAGNACHEYLVLPEVDKDAKELTCVHFQNGPIQENGVNGCQNEDLLEIVVDRLKGFQSGDFSCRENAIALTNIETALLWLNKRTNDRIDRGVEGTSVK